MTRAFIALGTCLLVTQAAAAEIKVEGADAVAELALVQAEVPTVAVPLKKLVVALSDAALTLPLSSVTVPTSRVPLSRIVLGTADAELTVSFKEPVLRP